MENIGLRNKHTCKMKTALTRDERQEAHKDDQRVALHFASSSDFFVAVAALPLSGGATPL